MVRPEDQPMQEPVVIGSEPAKRDEIELSTLGIEPSLVTLGFTERLPALIADLNSELGGNEFGESEDTPTRITYKLDPHRTAPRMVREESHNYGPRIELTVFPEKSRSVLKIGNIPVFSLSGIKMSQWLPMRGIYPPYIAHARLADLQGFVQRTFPDRKATLYRRGYKSIIDEDFSLVTQERVEELQTNQLDPSEPYMIRIEDPNKPDSHDRDFDPFLVLGLDQFFGGPDNPKREKVFNIHALVYDSEEYQASGENIERVLEGVRELWAEDPFVEMYNQGYRQKAAEARRKILGVKEGVNFNGKIRLAERADLPELRKILETWIRWQGEVIPEEVDEDLEHIKKSIFGFHEGDEKYLVAEDQTGRVVGMMGLAVEPKPELKVHSTTERPMELIRAYVDKDFRRNRGVGRALIGQIEALAKINGGTEIILDSGPRYEDTGHGFYDRMGYPRVAINNDFYGPDGDAVVWSKVLE